MDVGASQVVVGCVSYWSTDPRWCFRDGSTGMWSSYGLNIYAFELDLLEKILGLLEVDMINVAKSPQNRSFHLTKRIDNRE